MELFAHFARKSLQFVGVPFYLRLSLLFGSILLAFSCSFSLCRTADVGMQCARHVPTLSSSFSFLDSLHECDSVLIRTFSIRVGMNSEYIQYKYRYCDNLTSIAKSQQTSF